MIKIILDALTTDPGLLKKHSSYKSYHIPSTGFTYPSIRVFYRPHPQGDKFPSEPTPLPLLVFIHGLGGSVAQFHPLLTSLVNIAPCLAIDLPGCGLSSFAPKKWGAYTSDALVQLLATVIEDHLNTDKNQGAVLIGHSMGCGLAALLASSTSPHINLLDGKVLGLIGICPKAEPPDEAATATFRKLLWVPGWLFDLWRRWDRRGGAESASVRRFAGPDADMETKKLQVRFNEQSRTPVWRRMAAGVLPVYKNGTPVGGLPGQAVWAGLDMPVFLLAGEADAITPATEVEKIARFLGKIVTPKDAAPMVPEPNPGAPKPLKHDSPMIEATESLVNPNTNTTSAEKCALVNADTPSKVRHHSSSLTPFKTTILPPPASHTLLYSPTTARTLAGLLQSFLSAHISERLDLGWQLQYLTTEGKWDVKNLAKWASIAPVSAPIAGVFRAMKTLREVDDVHCPTEFVKRWRGKVAVVLDISHESPVYDPAGLERGGVEYRKFPTVSKLPPTVDEVKAFVEMVDELREKSSRGASRPDGDEAEALATWGEDKPLIGVHCHYGFNRTGFFLVSYMVERLGYGLQDALDEFATRRPPGIKHDHFIDTLYVRYTVGLKRAPTL